MHQRALDLNADLGEGIGDDTALLDIVTSANIACGGHAGDADTMTATCTAAQARGVRIGAHPAYPDRTNFGRVEMTISEVDLTQAVRTQVQDLIKAATAVGATVRYLKPHGALYHAAAREPEHARAVVRVATEWGLAVVGAPGALLLELAEQAGLPAIAEGFADRGYTPVGDLIARGEPGDVLHDREQIRTRIEHLVREGSIPTADGPPIPLQVRTVCVHGDSPGAVAIATAVRATLEEAGLPPAPFT